MTTNAKNNINQQVIFQHQEFIVMNKPGGIGFHDEENLSGYFNQVQAAFNQKLYPVHRLDKVTSGVLILAKSSSAASFFEHAFRTKQIEKTYIAIAPGKPKKKQGWIKGDMESSRCGQYRLCRTQNNPAITQFSSQAIGKGMRGYTLYPKTGKTHQLRVAMKSVGAPIAGDMLYGAKEQMADYDRCYLHALKIAFTGFDETFCISALPTNGELFLTTEATNWYKSLLSS